MATIKSNAAPETLLPDRIGTRGAGSNSAEFESLIEFCKSAELDNAALRIIEVITDDVTSPEFVRLKYSYPAVTIGVPGYKDSKSKIVKM
jgi:hypothetical protein